MAKRYKQPRLCKICGTEFQPTNSNQCYCCAACRHQGHLFVQRRSWQKIRSLETNELAAEKHIDEPNHKKPFISLNEAARLANDAHMTYGKYVLKHGI